MAVNLSLCFCHKGTMFMPYMAKNLIQCPINVYDLYKIRGSNCFIILVEIENLDFSPTFF